MNKQSGTTLIEVLVTVLILATSLLAMAALQSRSLQHNHSSFLRSQANIIAYDVIDRVRIYTQDAATPVRPTDAELAVSESVLPEGDITLECDTNRVCTVVITWAEQDGTSADGESSSFAYSTKI